MELGRSPSSSVATARPMWAVYEPADAIGENCVFTLIQCNIVIAPNTSLTVAWTGRRRFGRIHQRHQQRGLA
jgi:hypothetical protein